MAIRINPKEASVIINSLEAGVVPNMGVQHLLVGRNREVEEVIKILDSVADGRSDIRFWVGDFGSGKSFMLATIEQISIQKNFVVSTLDLNPSRRFYANDRKAVALYTEIIDNIKTKTVKTGNALDTIVEEWLNDVFSIVADKNNVEISEIIGGNYKKEVSNEILNTIGNFSAVGLSFEFGEAIVKFYEGLIEDNRILRANAIRWLRGDITTKTESKKLLGINKIINDDNWFDALKNMSELFLGISYSGFVVNFDEAVNLYKLPQSVTRERNYERILNIYNECKSNIAKGLFINFGATRKTIFDENRGLSSYGALKGRLGSEESMDNKLINTNRTVLGLKALTNEEIYTLLENLVNIYNVNYKESISISENEIITYMEGQLNRPGADEFLTPRAVIKDFIEILDLKRQNPNNEIMDILTMRFKDILTISKDPDDLDDEIEII
ncbi:MULTISPECIES: ATP-binding protein [Anaerococcus]|uniref:ATP-binding protein n=1 Tax=Anaerococcus TaxID=165779 RepID=UPI001FE43B5C|nr:MULTISPECIES: ATP-binding protein [Anaerococcus]MDU2354274.1 ATP-binding protein [Anaerococcus sp.]MDU2565834.1 ATP-binding protein [Anaerococcus sp.]